MRRWLLVLVVASSANAALAETNVTLVAGNRDETDREDRLPAVGVGADFGKEHWRIRPEFAFAIGFDPLYGGDETEISIGGIGYWDAKAARIHFGAGLSDLSSDWGANSGSSTTAYVHGGATWPIKTRRLGFDVRYLDADNFTVAGGSFPVGYLQVGVMFIW